MKTLFLYLFLVYLSGSLLSQNETYSKARVLLKDKSISELEKIGISPDHGTYKPGHFYINDFSKEQLKLIREQGFEVEVLIEDVVRFYQQRAFDESEFRNANCTNETASLPEVPENFKLGSMGGYYTYQEFLDEVDLMTQKYPNLISAKKEIGNFKTYEDRPIYWLKISDNPNQDEDEAEVLYTSIHHAREPLSLSNTIFYMWYLLENYDKSDRIRFLVDESELYFVPLLNPDGYIYNETTEPQGGGLWRKNRRDNNNGTFGVDLNRNYGHAWGTTGISMNPSADTYPGTGQFSEPETQAMKWFCEQHQFRLAFNAHTYSNLFLFPIGSTENDFAEEHDYFQSLGNHFARDNHFVAQKASLLYPASGDSDDYMYLEDLDVKDKIYAFTPEIGSQADGFWPASGKITPTCQLMLHANLSLAHAAHNYWTANELDASKITSLTGSFHHRVQRLGLENQTLNLSLKPLQGIQQLGTPINYQLDLNASQEGEISFQLDPLIQNGDTISYILTRNLGKLTLRDTVIKTFGGSSMQLLDPASNTDQWIGNWSQTDEFFVSPDFSFTDSPNSTYANGDNKFWQLKDTINLMEATQAEVQFYARWDIEADFDYARLEVSIDNGMSWIGQCGKYTVTGSGGFGSVQPNNEPLYEGQQNDWVLEEISLNDYLGEKILLRFVLKSDQGVAKDGFYVDDFKLFYDQPNKKTENPIFQVFPSPAQDILYISYPTSLQGFVLKLYDEQGRLSLSRELQNPGHTDQVNISGLSHGIYQAELIDLAKNSHRTKVMIIH
ncbi:MAG: hypothetical protein EP338_06835 [Bacteroidetes bacterium]|nr:MAG: hypothetical protein EP338_06835 [Bacteroidota bacterium]